ncbi:iron-siderophore ABC transporter substrate-binding protein [Frigidibacter sp. MR17.14]|uniref:iron-siderophore ABC transporter substrate-binding protein n=1 Tax=Frigidibacter sp. MR17.14 TaxID=3126509 RepID=UPI003FA5DD7B
MRLLRLASLVLAVLAAPQARADDYPITIHHAFGTTVIDSKPQRIATVNWANHEVPLALGVVPVGFARANFGDDDGDGLLPWVTEALRALGAPPPPLFDEGDGIDFEAVAAARPDVILAAYSGLSENDYRILSRIAPVVASPGAPWSTGWRQMIEMNSEGMGMAAEGRALVARLEARIADTRAAHPEFEGRRALFVTHLAANDLSRISFYTDNDARVRFFHDLGLGSPQMVHDASASGAFSAQVSAETIDALADVDVMVSYGGPALREGLKANRLTAHLPAVERDALVLLGNDPTGTAANPTPLSLPWVLDAYADMLSSALRGAP